MMTPLTADVKLDREADWGPGGEGQTR